MNPLRPMNPLFSMHPLRVIPSWNFGRSVSLLTLTVVLGLCGCKDNPAKWPTDRVASEVAERLELTGLSLTSTVNGLEGTGQRSDGETVSVIVSLQPETSQFTWEAKGDRGFVEEGYYQLQ